VPAVGDWAEIRRPRRAEGRPILEIAPGAGGLAEHGEGGAGRRWPPEYRRAPAGSVADAFEPRIREPLRGYRGMPSTVLAERIGWPYSIRALSGRVAGLRPACLPPTQPAARALRRAR
jgi:hypothetical protein